MPALAHAGSASEVTPPTLRPPPAAEMRAPVAAPREGSLRSDEGPASAGSNLSFVAGQIRLVGEEGPPPPGVEDLLAAARGKRASVADLFALAAALERVYNEAGFLLVRVVVPPQALVDHGSVVLRIVDGFIEDVDASGIPERQRAAVMARLGHLVGRPRLHNDDLERALLVAGGLSGLTLKSALGRGRQPGGTLLVLNASHKRVSGHVSTDNRQSDNVGGWAVSGNLAVNSLLGRGEQVYVSATTPTQPNQIAAADSPMQVTGIGLVIPLGTDGLTFNPEFTHTATFDDGGFFTPATKGKLTRIALRFTYPLYLTRQRSLTLTTAAEYLNETSTYSDFGLMFRRDRYWSLRPGLEGMAWLAGGRHVAGSIVLSQGLGGRDIDDVMRTGVGLSRLGASPRFTKLNATATLRQPLDAATTLMLTARGQAAFGSALLQNERFSLDGTDAVSTFIAGGFRVDEGATLRAELQRNVPLPLDRGTLSVTPYLFASAGRGVTNEATVLEASSVTAAGFGAGVRIDAGLLEGRIGTSSGLEIGRQYTDLPGVREEWRLNLNMSVRF